MAQTGYTPIQLYYSTAATLAPTAGNLAAGELAINITDGKLYYKDNSGVVQLIASKATSGITLPLIVANGGSGATSFGTGLLKSNGTSAFTNAVAGTDYAPITAGTSILAGNGLGGFTNLPSPSAGFLQWTGAAYLWNTAIGAGSVTQVSGSGGTTGLTLTGGPITTIGTLTLGGVLNAVNGGTGLSSFTANRAIYSNSTSTLTNGILPVAAGGLGTNTFTPIRAIYSSSTNSLANGILPNDAGGTGVQGGPSPYSFLMSGTFYNSSTSSYNWSTGYIFAGPGISISNAYYLGFPSLTISASNPAIDNARMYFYGQF